MGANFPLPEAIANTRATARPPKIGIRPVIDGRRRGVRESLEHQVMAMARSAATLYERDLRHPDGRAVECVVADTCIGGVAEASACAEQFARAGVGVSLTVTPCWCYGTEVMDADPVTPKGVWGFNGTERPGAVYLAAALAGYAQKGLPAFGIYGRDVQDKDDTTIPEDARRKLLLFARAGLAVARMRGQSYLSIGGTSMGIAGSIVDQDFLQSYLGMRTEAVDMSEIVRRMEEGIFDRAEFDAALAWVKAHCREGADANPASKQASRARKDAEWETCVQCAIIVRDLMVGNPRLREAGWDEESLGHHALVAGFQGQRAWTDHWPNGDFLESMLNSSFDWTGIRQPFIVATENDSLNGVAMLFGHLLTATASLFADVRTFWSPAAVRRVTGSELAGRAAAGVIHLLNSGAAALDASGRLARGGQPCMKPFWEITEEEADACLRATTWCPAVRDYFRGGGYSSRFVTCGEWPLTMIRVNMVKGLGPVLQLAEGWTVDLPDQVHAALDARTDPTWPTTWFAPKLTGSGAFTDAYSVMANWGANHAAATYGHIGDQVLALASMLRIPVNMHNVEAGRIFRPASWSAFGTSDPEGADYRACAAYGPLYA
ncbi:MAG TPA: L-fucose isomerase [Vicinamibacterales bacterium]|jgi:L-fucose isomerase